MWVTPNFCTADLIELYVFTSLVIIFCIVILWETANNLLPLAKGEKVAFFLAVFKFKRADCLNFRDLNLANVASVCL